jgi:uncharacterized protein (DUF1800 family)
MFLASCANLPVTVHRSTPTLVTGQIRDVNPELLVDRITWGKNSTSVEDARELGTTAYLQQQLSSASTSTMPQVVQDRIATMTISQKSLIDIITELEKLRKSNSGNAKKKLQQELNRLAKETQSRSILRALYSPQQLEEQLCWFWFNHFNVFQGKANLRAMVGDYEERAIRPHVLGKFRELLTATAHHPAMLRYLDNNQNTVNKPNENYARAVLELHTMGAHNGNTQRDIQELARILTGVGFNFSKENLQNSTKMPNQYVRNGLFEFNPDHHDYGDKQFLGHTISGRGLAELDEAIGILSRQPATAYSVSKKLALFFIGDAPSSALIDSMAQTFLSTDGDIRAVLEALFLSSEFARSLGKQYKDPHHFVISALRLAFDGKLISATDPVINWLSRLGQPRYEKLAPQGYTLTASAWENQAQTTARLDIVKIIGSGKAGLFKKNSGNGVSAIPQLNNALYSEYIRKSLTSTTLAALQKTKTTQEWNTVLLASPEMMMR